MKGVFIDPENLQEKIPSVVKEFEGKGGKHDVEEETQDNPENLQEKILIMLEELKVNNDHVRNQPRDNTEDMLAKIVNMLEEVKGNLEKSDVEVKSQEKYANCQCCSIQ